MLIDAQPVSTPSQAIVQVNFEDDSSIQFGGLTIDQCVNKINSHDVAIISFDAPEACYFVYTGFNCDPTTRQSVCPLAFSTNARFEPNQAYSVKAKADCGCAAV